MSVLPLELVVEILKRLPVKTLYRCMSACRSWHSLITSYHFIATHLTYQKAISNGPKTYPLYHGYGRRVEVKHPGGIVSVGMVIKFHVFCDDGFAFRQISEYDLPFYTMGELVGDCDGMVCLYKATICFDHGSMVKISLTMLNVSQKKHLVVDFPHLTPESQCRRGVDTFYGFGFDAYHNDYKVVVVVDDSSFYVYSLKMGSWRRQNVSLPKNENIFPQGANLEGVIHWGMLVPSTSSDILPLFSILTFNLVDETFDQISFPKEVISTSRYPSGMYSWEFDGRDKVSPRIIRWHGKDCLSFCQWDDLYIFLWVMEKYGILESWKKVVKFRCDDMGQLLDFRTNGESVIHAKYGKLESKDLRTEKSEVISSDDILRHAGTYVESLVFLEPVGESLEETEGLR